MIRDIEKPECCASGFSFDGGREIPLSKEKSTQGETACLLVNRYSGFSFPLASRSIRDERRRRTGRAPPVPYLPDGKGG